MIIKKQETIAKKVFKCDFCENNSDKPQFILISNCDVCGKDFCPDHTGDCSEDIYTCKECLDKDVSIEYDRNGEPTTVFLYKHKRYYNGEDVFKALNDKSKKEVKTKFTVELITTAKDFTELAGILDDATIISYKVLKKKEI